MPTSDHPGAQPPSPPLNVPIAQPISPDYPPAAPVARPIRSFPPDLSRKTAAIQLAIVLSVGIGWLMLNNVVGLHQQIDRLCGDASIFVHVLANGAIGWLIVYAVLRATGRGFTDVGLARPTTRRTIGPGLLAIIPCYLANIGVSALYIALSRTDLIAMAENKMEAMNVLAPIGPAWVLPISIYVGLYEEMFFRGFLLSRLRALFAGPNAPSSRVANTAAILASAALFGLAHGYQGGLGMAQTFAVGVVLAAVAIWFGSIWPCIIAHFGIDALGLFLLYFVRPLLDQALHATTTQAA